MSETDLMGKLFHPIETSNPITDSLGLLFSIDEPEGKARIEKPSALANLKSFAKYIKPLGFEGASNLIKKRIKYGLEYSISDKGKSRAEYVEASKAMNALMTPELDLKDRLTKDLKDK